MPISNGAYRPLAPQAFAEVAPQFNEAYFAPRTGIQLQTTIATYGLMYRVQPHIHTAVEKVANLIARLTPAVYDTTNDQGDKIDKTGPYAKLMCNPCMTLPRFRFYHWVATTYEIYGEAYLIKNRGPTDQFGVGRVTSFVPMHPAMTQIKRHEDGGLLYGFTGSPDLWFPATEVVPFRRYNPDNTMRGLSRMEPLRQTLMNEDSARRAMKSMWDKGMRPGYVLSTAKRLGKRGRERLTASVQSVGGADNTGGVLLLEDDVTATRMQLDAEEMQYIESRKLNRDECFEVYDLNPTAVQVNDHLTSQSYEPITKDVYKASIDFRLQDIQSTFDFFVGEEFNSPKEFRFMVTKQLRGDIETLAPAIVQLIQSGVLMPKEGRDWLELPDGGESANHLYANQALQRLGQIGSLTTRFTEAGDQPDPAQPDMPKALPAGRSNNSSPNPFGDLPQSLPEMTDKAKQFQNQIFSGLGRGKRWDEVAHKLLDRNPLDRKDIQIACLHILVERETR